VATWSLLQTLTLFDFLSVCTDGTQYIYFVQRGGVGDPYNVYRYDTVGDSVSQISNSGSWSGTSPTINSNFGASAIQYFEDNLYVIIGTADDFRVFRYSGAGTSWSLMTTIPRTSGESGGLFCTSTHLILAPNNSSLQFDWAYYSNDGSSWSSASIASCGLSSCIDCAPIRFSNTYGQGVSPIFGSHEVCDFLCDPPYQSYCWFEWSGSGFDVTFSDHAQSSSIFDPQWDNGAEWLHNPENLLVDVLVWTSYTGTWQYSETLTGTWTTPTGASGSFPFPIVTIGPLGKQAGIDGSFDLVFLEAGEWVVIDTPGPGSCSHLVVMDNGDGFLFGPAPGPNTDGIWGRSEPFAVPPTPSTSRIWIYKTTNHGQSWESRGVVT
jgi:hypothetical protein